MNTDAAFLLIFLVAFAVLVLAVLWLLVQIGRLGRRVDQGFAEQQLQLVNSGMFWTSGCPDGPGNSGYSFQVILHHHRAALRSVLHRENNRDG